MARNGSKNRCRRRPDRELDPAGVGCLQRASGQRRGRRLMRAKQRGPISCRHRCRRKEPLHSDQRSGFRPVFHWNVGWRWLPNDRSWTAFGHTGGHTGDDANVCLSEHALCCAGSRKYFAWDDAKNAKLKADRGIGFEDIVFHIERDDLLDILEHPNPEVTPASASSSSSARTTCTWCRSLRTSTRSS
jgi:hypothetical protein